MDTKAKRVSFVVQPGEGESYWQPKPANGYAEVHVSKRNDPSVAGFSSGMQVIAPGSYIREHQHGVEQELLFFFEGRGTVVVNDLDHPVVPGTTAAVLGELYRRLGVTGERLLVTEGEFTFVAISGSGVTRPLPPEA